MQIADVTGHGIAAAFLGSMTKLALTAASSEIPDELFHHMNRLLTPQMPPGRFITMSSVRYDPKSGKLQFAKAGHLPGLVIHKNASGASFEQLKAPGFAMGFQEEGMYQLNETTLQPEDLFILCTDGFTEGQNRSGVMYGLDGLAQSAINHISKGSVDEILKDILSDFNDFLEGRLLKDDLTLLILRRKK